MKKTTLAAIMAVAALAFSFTACDKSDDPEPENQTANGTALKEGAGEAVDLGLPSGTLWADRNVGATENIDYGWYLAWGETEPKETYDWSTYKYASRDSWETISKYQIEDNQTDACWYNGTDFVGDGKTTLELSDDAARVNWGGRWRMPTFEQFEELDEKCKWTWTNNYYGKGVAGYNVEGPNGNAIFLPAAGYRWGSSFRYVGSNGNYWSAELYSGDSTNVREEFLCSGYPYADGDDDRYRGFSVRPVISPEE